MLRRALDGKEKLWVVFWIYFVAIGLLFTVSSITAVFYVSNNNLQKSITVLSWPMWIIWMCFTAITIWKNANNTHTHVRYIGMGAKGAYISYALLTIMGMFA